MGWVEFLLQPCRMRKTRRSWELESGWCIQSPCPIYGAVLKSSQPPFSKSPILGTSPVIDKLGHLGFFSLRKYHRTKILEIPLSESVGGHLYDPSHILPFTPYYRRTRRMVIPVALRRNLVMPVAFLLTFFACGFPWKNNRIKKGFKHHLFKGILMINKYRDSIGTWWLNYGWLMISSGTMLSNILGMIFNYELGIPFTTNQIAWIDGEFLNAADLDIMWTR